MDRIAKLLKKLAPKERDRLEETLTALLAGNSAARDIKKLKRVAHIYRVRSGDLRIIFKKENADIRILEISRRDGRTYRNF